MTEFEMGSLVLEANALITAPQPLPYLQLLSYLQCNP